GDGGWGGGWGRRLRPSGRRGRIAAPAGNTDVATPTLVAPVARASSPCGGQAGATSPACAASHAPPGANPLRKSCKPAGGPDRLARPACFVDGAQATARSRPEPASRPPPV